MTLLMQCSLPPMENVLIKDLVGRLLSTILFVFVWVAKEMMQLTVNG